MSARTCAQVQADLSAYLDGDLDAGLAAATRAHLDGCGACRSELDLLRLAVDTLHGLPDLPPPAGILTGVRARLRPEPWYRRLPGGGRWHAGFPLGAAATLLVVFGISLFVARYPDMPKTVSHDSARQSPAPATQTSPPLPAREFPAGSPQFAPPPPARDNGVSRKAVESKTTPVQAAPPDQPAASSKDFPEKESRRGENLAAAPYRADKLLLETTAERSATISDGAVGESAAVLATPARGSAAVADLNEKAETTPSSPEKMKAISATSTRKADSGAGLERAGFAAEKESAPTFARIVCLLPPDGDTVDDLEEVLRRAGASHIATSELEPPAVREALARYRERLGSLPEPSRGWTVNASVPSGELTRILEALAGRAGLRMLEQPAPPAASKAQEGWINLRVTVFR